jgi:hypothetical protein
MESVPNYFVNKENVLPKCMCEVHTAGAQAEKSDQNGAVPLKQRNIGV